METPWILSLAVLYGKMNGISISGAVQLRSIGCATGPNKSSSMIGGGEQWGGS